MILFWTFNLVNRFSSSSFSCFTLSSGAVGHKDVTKADSAGRVGSSDWTSECKACKEKYPLLTCLPKCFPFVTICDFIKSHIRAKKIHGIASDTPACHESQCATWLYQQTSVDRLVWKQIRPSPSRRQSLIFVSRTCSTITGNKYKKHAWSRQHCLTAQRLTCTCVWWGVILLPKTEEVFQGALFVFGLLQASLVAAAQLGHSSLCLLLVAEPSGSSWQRQHDSLQLLELLTGILKERIAGRSHTRRGVWVY